MLGIIGRAAPGRAVRELALIAALLTCLAMPLPSLAGEIQYPEELPQSPPLYKRMYHYFNPGSELPEFTESRGYDTYEAEYPKEDSITAGREKCGIEPIIPERPGDVWVFMYRNRVFRLPGFNFVNRNIKGAVDASRVEGTECDVGNIATYMSNAAKLIFDKKMSAEIFKSQSTRLRGVQPGGMVTAVDAGKMGTVEESFLPVYQAEVEFFTSSRFKRFRSRLPSPRSLFRRAKCRNKSREVHHLFFSLKLPKGRKWELCLDIVARLDNVVDS